MKNEEINYVIDMLKNMMLDDKLRVAVCMTDSSYMNFEYDKEELHKYFNNLLKEVDITYTMNTINPMEYPYTIFVVSKIMEMDTSEQNQVAMYLFNSIEIEMKN